MRRSDRAVILSAHVALASILAVACTGQILGGDSSGSSSGAPSAVTSTDGGSETTPRTDGSVTGEAGSVPDEASAESSADSTSAGTDGGAPCGAVMDSYGYTRCICSPGSSGLGEAGRASCVGYDCCVRYPPDSGVSLGFANPALTAGLCACFTSGDLTAVSGVSTTCADFVGHGGGVGTVVSSCP
jgi:hypothetical protein